MKRLHYTSGHDFMDSFEPRPGEAVIDKQTRRQARRLRRLARPQRCGVRRDREDGE
jgi:hypothetical protein